jgi:ketosteroid isomerase-like protein
MSRENLEVCRRGFEAFQRGLAAGDPAGALFDSGAVDPDLEWLPPRGFPGPPVYRGREGFAEFMRYWTEDFEDFSLRLERLIDVDDHRVVGLFHHKATGQGSGVPVELHQGLVYELEGGRVIRCRNYFDHAEALEAVGLQE